MLQSSPQNILFQMFLIMYFYILRRANLRLYNPNHSVSKSSILEKPNCLFKNGKLQTIRTLLQNV